MVEIKWRGWEYEDAEFGDPEHIEFDPDHLIDAAVEVYLNSRKSSPTVRDPQQFEPTLEDLRRSSAIAAHGRSPDCAQGKH